MSSALCYQISLWAEVSTTSGDLSAQNKLNAGMEGLDFRLVNADSSTTKNPLLPSYGHCIYCI